ncbi:protein of unknown function DUF4111 [Kalmanozyma brasiliensis GHG001]|uniref:protein of unknown function DUF4111 n=1 Tax=Kalmanozyma brasiliensis (strain GHG001) TaxID=1365824 RepID=UPI001CEBED35|nr:protein of unknown function DUF4111 [Kalmanozyma brasiliensis GHG001]KAF6767581.1 protein of unknown function DUF4111 [Kalmanozyma brasiliensis GHG001]
MKMAASLPEEVDAYLAELVKRLQDLLADRLVGIYLFGSASYDACEHGRSDLDVQAVVKDPLDAADKQAIVDRLTHKALPCPATKLEFVVYAQSTVHPANRHPRFELNLNTGSRQADHVSFDPANESSHWFLLDIALGRQLGRSLFGLLTRDAFAAIPRRWILEAIADSLKWHQANELASPNSVLNACRGWRYAVTGSFSSKVEGADWAMQQAGVPDVIGSAITARGAGGELPADQVSQLYRLIEGTVNAELGTTEA